MKKISLLLVTSILCINAAMAETKSREQLAYEAAARERDAQMAEEDARISAAMPALLQGMNELKSKVASDIALPAPYTPNATPQIVGGIKKYEMIRKNGGSLRETCIGATAITNALLNQGNETGYANWKKVRDYNCLMSKSNPGL